MIHMKAVPITLVDVHIFDKVICATDVEWIGGVDLIGGILRLPAMMYTSASHPNMMCGLYKLHALVPTVLDFNILELDI